MVGLVKGFKGWAITLLLMGLVISGCSTNPTTKAEQTPATESAASGKNTSGTETEPATRVVQDEFGEMTIPVQPQRIAGIYVEDYLKALDITPVVQWYHPLWGVQDYLNLDVSRFDMTGSIESLLQYDPDLIIVDGAVDAAKYEMYSKVAPTYRLPESILQDSVQILNTIADVVGKPEKASEYVSEFKQKITDAKSELQDAVGDETVAVVRLNIDGKTLALFGAKNRYTGFIYSELGLTPHPLVGNMEEYHQLLSEEAIPDLDADHIIVFPSNGTWSSEENQEAIQVLDGKLWQSLPAVKNKHVYMMERSHWQSGAVIANSMKIDDLLEKMTP